jgi:hypothetical protein
MLKQFPLVGASKTDRIKEVTIDENKLFQECFADYFDSHKFHISWNSNVVCVIRPAKRLSWATEF